MRPDVTVAVVTWNSSGLVRSLAGTLRGLRPLCKVVISDNASSDGTPDLIGKELPWAKVLRNERNGGFGYGNNRVIEVCDTEYLLLLNSDASIDAGMLQVLVDTISGEPLLAGVQPVIRMWDWPMVTLSTGCAMNEYGCGYDMDFMHFQPHPDPAPREVPCLSAALSLYRTEALRRAGGFDQRMFMYFEDIDLSLRLRAQGMGLLLQPAASASHVAGASSARGAARKWELASSAYMARKYLGGSECRLPHYWMRREWRTRAHSMIHGKSWLWRTSALSRKAGRPADHVHIDRDTLSWVLSPRPLRMPRPRPPTGGESSRVSGGVSLGPGWDRERTGPWGFGCLSLPGRAGRLALELVSCDIPGSVALWSGNRMLARTFIGRGGRGGLETLLESGTGKIYVVPDRHVQTLELERADFQEA